MTKRRSRQSLWPVWLALLAAPVWSACVHNYGPVGLLSTGILGVLRPGNSYRFSTFPSQLTIPLPQTLSAQTLATTGAHTKFQVSTCSAQSFGYQEVREIVSTLRQVAKDAYRELMVVDGLVPKVRAEYPANTCVEGGAYTLVWTAEMREGVFSSIEDAGLSAGLAQSLVLQLEQEGYIPRVGQSVPSPVMQYRANQNGYDHELRYSFSPDGMTELHTCDEVAGSFDSVARWNQSRTKFQLGYQESFDTETYSGILTINLATSTMFFRESYDDAGDSYNTTVGVSTCTGPRCVLINMTELYSSGGVDEVYRLDGKADDNGGYVRTNYTYNDGANTDYYKEYFGVGGTVLGMLESADDITYTTVSGCDDYDYEDDDYDTGATVEVGINVSIGAVVCGGAAVDCQFVVVPDAVDPNLNPEAIIGSGGQIIDGAPVIDYWGEPGAELTTADIWEITGYTGQGVPIYGNMIDGMLTQI